MKLAFLYGPFSLGNRPIEFDRLYTSKRGLTGSELSCIEYARHMAERGHEVELFIGDVATTTGKVRVRPICERIHIDSSYRAAYAWNEPDMLANVKPSGPRMLNQQLNDFAYCRSGFARFVDVFTSPSRTHLEYVSQFTPEGSRWEVVPNGCDPQQYGGPERIPGRVIYASSPDRGLHWLLQQWPEIKRRVPHATLRIFYEMGPWLETFLGQELFRVNGEIEKGLTETGYRARYIAQAIRRLDGCGIQAVGSTSRAEMAREMSQAECLAYPCDPIRWTEGFSVTTLEGCASGAVPVVSKADALGSIYAGLPTLIEMPLREHIQAFTDGVVRVLTDKDYAEDARKVGRAIARRHEWENLAEDLEEIINGY